LTTTSSPQPRIAPRALLGALLLLVLLVLGASGQATAATACGKKVINDWYDNGRVDGSYALHCYDDAIDALPRDVRDYSSAKEDITRALQARMDGRPAPPATTDPSPDTTGTPPATGPDDLDGDGIPNDSDPTPKPGDDGENIAGPGDVDTAASDSFPLPLLILAGLALLLVAAGSVGYGARRLQARRGPPPLA